MATTASGFIREAEQKLRGILTSTGENLLGGTINVPDTVIIPDEHEHYAPGDPDAYIVQSQADDDQVIPTKNKILDDDITVKKIEYHATTNSGGGLTVYVAQQPDT